MENDTKSLVQSFYAHLKNGDPAAAFALMSSDIEWREAEGNPLADRNPYIGAAAIGEGVFGRLAGIFDEFAAVPEEFIAENDRVVVFTRYSGIHRKTGTPLDCPAVHSWWVRDGKIVRFQQYADTEQLSRLN